MKKLHFAVMAALILSGASVFAQTDSLSEPDASNIGNDSAKQALREVSVDRFEREGSWNVHISPDYGVISGRLFDGSPLAKEPLEDADNQEMEDTKVFGVKTEFFRRGVNSFYITAARPIPIADVIWVTRCGFWFRITTETILKSGWVHLSSADGRNLLQQFHLHRTESTELSSRVFTMETNTVFAL